MMCLVGVILGSYSGSSLLCRDVGRVCIGLLLTLHLLGGRKLELFENVDFGVKPVSEPWLCYLLTWDKLLKSVKLPSDS